MKLIDKDKLKDFPIRAETHWKEEGDNKFVSGIESVMDYIDEMPVVEAIPIAYIKKMMKDNAYIAGNATPKVERAYMDSNRTLKTLLDHWELFGKQWEREQNG